MTSIQELRLMTDKQLKTLLEKSVRERSVARFQTRTQRELNTAKLKKLGKLIAQIKTLFREKELNNDKK